MDKKNHFSKLKNLDSVYIMLIVLGVLYVLLSITSPRFLVLNNQLNILRQISISTILAFGMTVVIISGGIDLSVGVTTSFASVIVAFVAASGRVNGVGGVVITLIVGMAAGALIGLVNGITIAFFRLAPFIVTLGMMTIGRGVQLLFTDGRQISNFFEDFLVIGGRYLFGIPIPVYFLLACFAVTLVLLRYTRFGMNLYAIGGNVQSANVVGINIKANIIKAYLFCGLMAGLAGCIMASRLQNGNPSSGGGFELDAIAAAVIGGASLTGGIGSAFGTLVGAVLLGVVSNGMDMLQVPAYWQQIVSGLIIILAVILDAKRTK